MRPALPLLCLALSLTLLQSGCTALASLDAAAVPLDIYELRAPDPAPASRRRPVELVVEEPIATGALATERIMIRPGALQAQYLPGVRWPDPAPVMVQTLILRTLLRTEALTSVGRRPVGQIADYALLGELTDFQAEVRSGGQVVVRTALIARLLHERDARVIATRAFEAEVAAGSDRPADLIPAFDAAAGRLVAEVAQWTLARLGP